MASDSTDLENYYATSSSVLRWRRCLTCWQVLRGFASIHTDDQGTA